MRLCPIMTEVERVVLNPRARRLLLQLLEAVDPRDVDWVPRHERKKQKTGMCLRLPYVPTQDKIQLSAVSLVDRPAKRGTYSIGPVVANKAERSRQRWKKATRGQQVLDGFGFSRIRGPEGSLSSIGSHKESADGKYPSQAEPKLC